MRVDILYPKEDMGYECDSNWYTNASEVEEALKIMFPDAVEGKIIHCRTLDEYTKLTSALIKIMNDIGVEKTTISLG